VVVLAPRDFVPPALGQRDPAAIGVPEPDVRAAELGSRVASRQPDDLVRRLEPFSFRAVI
jgi:hypothetical protein